MRGIPAWAYALAVVFFVLGVSSVAYTWSECGWKTLLLGNGGFYAAIMGLCK
jgi:hypothetical protein